MKHIRWVLLTILLLLVAACAPKTPQPAPVLEAPPATLTLTRTPAPSRTPLPTVTESRTPRPTRTHTNTPIPTETPLPTLTNTPGPSPTPTLSATARVTPTPFSYGPTATPSPVPSDTQDPTETPDATGDAGEATTTSDETDEAEDASSGGTLPDDAREALRLACGAMARLQSLHNEHTMTLEITFSAGYQYHGTFSGNIDALLVEPDDADFALQENVTVASSGVTEIIETGFVKVGERYWDRVGDQWIEGEVGPDTHAAFAPYHRDAFIFNEAATATWVGEGEVDGTPARHLSYTVDISDIRDLPPLQGRRSAVIPDAEEIHGSISGEAWIDPVTNYILRQNMVIEAEILYFEDETISLTLNYEVTAGQFDAVDEIYPPPID